jgi:hypothetical protein
MAPAQSALFAGALLLSSTPATAGNEEPPEYFALQVDEPLEIAKRQRSFEKNLRAAGWSGRLISCRMMTDVTSGKRGSNHSYGAVCDLVNGKHRATLLLCNDKMVGHFAMSTSFVEAPDWIVRFTKNNCTGG